MCIRDRRYAAQFEPGGLSALLKQRQNDELRAGQSLCGIHREDVYKRQVRMEISGPLSPVKVLPAEGNDFLYLVLPVRFTND